VICPARVVLLFFLKTFLQSSFKSFRNQQPLVAGGGAAPRSPLPTTEPQMNAFKAAFDFLLTKKL
jgi:hypothetical protein